MPDQFSAWPKMQVTPELMALLTSPPPQAAAAAPAELPVSRSRVSETEIAPVSQSDYEQLAQRLNTKGIDSLRMQSQGVGDLEKLRNDMLQQGEVQTDLTPLMALVDSWSTRSKGNNAATYAKPTSGEERQSNLRQMQAQIQKAREGVSSQEMDLLKSQLGVAAQKEQVLERRASEAKEHALRRELAQKSADKRYSPLDKDYVKDYNDFVSAGGSAESRKLIDQMKEARKRIQTNSNLTGPGIGYLPFKSLTAPGTKEVQDLIDGVSQGNLRATLGAQFTEKEGALLVQRAFDPNLSAKENLERMDRVITQMERAADAKLKAAEYFENNGTLDGFKGLVYTKPATATASAGGTKETSVSAAEKWLLANPNHPDAAAVKRKLGK
jgi:hypothetical protein